MFGSLDSSYSTMLKVEKSEEESENRMKCVCNELKPWRVFIGGGGAKFDFFGKKSDFFEL
jgi:hypothetical protein